MLYIFFNRDREVNLFYIFAVKRHSIVVGKDNYEVCQYCYQRISCMYVLYSDIVV
jgi:hypothetical protein